MTVTIYAPSGPERNAFAFRTARAEGERALDTDAAAEAEAFADHFLQRRNLRLRRGPPVQRSKIPGKFLRNQQSQRDHTRQRHPPPAAVENKRDQNRASHGGRQLPRQRR